MSADNWRNCPKCGTENEAREDYEIYSKKDVVYVTYTIHCRRCNYSYEFKINQLMPDLNISTGENNHEKH